MKKKENESYVLIAIDVISKYTLAISPNMAKKPTIILSIIQVVQFLAIKFVNPITGWKIFPLDLT